MNAVNCSSLGSSKKTEEERTTYGYVPKLYTGYPNHLV